MPDTPPSSDPQGEGPLLDYSPKNPVQRDYASAATAMVQYCQYCKAPLDPFFYFCLRCATPYKTVMSLTGPARPAPLTDGQRITRMAPHTWTVFWTYAAVVGACFVLSIPWSFVSGPSPLFDFLATLAIFVTTAIFTCIHWRPLAAQLKTSGFWHWEAWAGIAALVPLLLLNYGIYLLYKSLRPEEIRNLTEGMSMPVAILIVCVFPAITEEIAFRGLIQYWLEVSLTPTKALMLGSALFAALHLSIAFPYLFLVGLTLAWVRRRTGSLYPGMLIHFLHNLVVVTCFGV